MACRQFDVDQLSLFRLPTNDFSISWQRASDTGARGIGRPILRVLHPRLIHLFFPSLNQVMPRLEERANCTGSRGQGFAKEKYPKYAYVG